MTETVQKKRYYLEDGYYGNEIVVKRFKRFYYYKDEHKEEFSTTTTIVGWKRLSSAAISPKRYTKGSVRYDLFSPVDGKILPSSNAIIPLDIAIYLPSNTYGRVAPRSSQGKKFVGVGAGVVDIDYT